MNDEGRTRAVPCKRLTESRNDARAQAGVLARHFMRNERFEAGGFAFGPVR